MKPVDWYVTRYYQIMSTLLKLGLSGYDVKPRFVRSNVNISYKFHFFFVEKFLVALDTYAKKIIAHIVNKMKM